MNYPESAVLDKLIHLHALSRAAVSKIYKIAIATDSCKDVLRAHENTSGGLVDKSDIRTAALLDTELLRLTESSPQLCAAFLGKPWLSEIEPATLAVLASIADVRPNDRGIPVTRDSSFSYVAALVLDEAGTTTSDRLIQAFVRRLVGINAKYSHLIAKLRDTTFREDYRDLVKNFDNWLDRLALAPASLSAPSEDIESLIAACGSTFNRQADRGLLYELPRLSQIPIEFIQSFPIQQPQGAEAASGSSTTSLLQQARHNQDVLDAMMKSGRSELERTIQIRLDAAKEYLARRQFAKAQMLEFGWPQLAARARTASGMQRLRNLEKAVLAPEREYNFSAYWLRLLADERLTDFLSIPPYFNDIPAEEFAGIAEEFAGISDINEGLAADEPESSSLDGDRVDFGEYKDIELIFNPTHGKELATSGHVSVQFKLRLQDGEEGNDRTEVAVVEVPADPIRKMLSLLEEAYIVSFRQDQRPYSLGDQTARRVVANPFPLPDDVLEDIGNVLWSALMETAEAEPVRRLFNAAIKNEEHLRLIFTNNEPELSDMPWECLYVPDMRAAAGLTLKTSVVRNIPDPVSLVRRSMGHPLRMLIVSSAPADLPWINADQEVALLRRSLSPAERAGLVRLEVLPNPDEAKLQDRLRSVRPHIFHFIGHGAVLRNGEGVMALADENKNAVFISASQFGTILRDHGILLSVLNSCFSGGETDFDMARSVARVLVGHGVPVAIATARAVLDRVALQFAREFYTALVDGYPIEAAVVEARKLLSVKGWDWSAYVLYAAVGSPLLDFRVSPPG